MAEFIRSLAEISEDTVLNIPLESLHRFVGKCLGVLFTLAGPTESKTDGQRGPGGASRSLGGRDDPRSLSTSARRWIPPSTLKRDAHSHDNKNDLIFRKVRGILNKLTPEKFLKLSDDLLSVGLDSTVVLKGVILLIFEKALDEPKYSSMYAQLCKRLSDEAPNFETPPNPCTFRQLLLNRCRVEFENRSQANTYYDSKDGPLSAEEEDQRQLAKRKMLGNIKFIGELGKLEMLQDSILHKCCLQLLEKKRRGGIREMAEDLECLSQIMRTCGRILDNDKGRNYMDQYFDRMSQLAVSMRLPARIRFMLQDSIDLRNNRWVPRKTASIDGPRTIQQIREEAARDAGIYIPSPGSMGGRGGPNGPAPGNFNMSMGGAGAGGLFGNRGPKGTGLDVVFGSLPLGAASIGTGPGVISHINDPFEYEPNAGLGNNYRGRSSYGPPSQSFYNGSRPNNGGSGGGGERERGGSSQNIPNNKPLNLQQQNANNAANAAKNDLPPRFKKMMMAQQRSQASNEEVSLRPSANSMVLKPKTTPTLPKSASASGPLGLLVDAALPIGSQPLLPKMTPPSLHKEVPILIKQASADKNKNLKKDKGPTKEEWLKKIESWLQDHLTRNNLGETVQCFKDLKLPERYVPEALVTMIETVLDKPDSDRETVSCVVARLKLESLVSCSQFLDAYREVLARLTDLELHVPRVKSYIAGFAARAIGQELVTLFDIATPLEHGVHYPLFLLTLQQLNKAQSKGALVQLFNKSKINLMQMLPEMDRTKDRLTEILEDRDLTFLFPLLRIQSDLSKQLKADPSPTQFYKWIKENVDASQFIIPGFVSALFTVLLKHITQEAGTVVEGTSDLSSWVPEKTATEKEKDLLEKYRPVLQAFLHDHTALQVTALYALQAFCHGLHFPKGMLLRWFVQLYEMEIVEEEAFLKWKEDLNDETPGKGKSLFQVNQWLMWLEQAESDEEEEGDA